MDDSRGLERRPGRPRGGRVIYVACEGQKTEPEYLEYLTDTYGAGAADRPEFILHRVPTRRGLRPDQTVAAVEREAAADEAWVLFDRDQHRESDIQQALRDAAEARVEVGFSHPSFELWFLLHFQAFSGAQHGSSDTVVDKLRNSRVTDAFRDYARHDKSVKSPARRNALRHREQDAVDHARALVNRCEHADCHADNAQWDLVPRAGDQARERISWQRWSARSGHAEHCPVLGRDPSTDVWRLLVSLGIATVPDSPQRTRRRSIG
ncbi:RloB family protein [Nocardia sp. SYP-A9097]|uniref:RloB family protein n=1 Tax=Nocardia sp. SYP-A9097 TaxID=2663237 RepID=UPI00129A4C3E|nr:RloB family protein [Nocardia sp. SYP-A9097]